MVGKEVRRTTWKDCEGKVYPVVTVRHSNGFLKREYLVRVDHVTRPHSSPSHEIAAIGTFSTARAAESAAIGTLEQREERLSHY